MIFDFDGTLFDTVKGIHRALNRLLATEGCRALSAAEVIPLMSEGSGNFITNAFATVGATVAESEVRRLLHLFSDFHEPISLTHTKLYPGARQILGRLHAEGYKLGVCTNKPISPALKLIEAFGLEAFFAGVIGGNSGHGLKPEPGPVLAAIEALQSKAGQTVMVGDTIKDVAAARAAGIQVFAVTFGYAEGPPEELGADGLIGNFAELPARIEDLAGNTA